MLQTSSAEKQTNVATRLMLSSVMSIWISKIKIAPKEQKRGELEIEGTLQDESLKGPFLGMPIDCRFKNPKDSNTWKKVVKTCETIAFMKKITPIKLRNRRGSFEK